MWFDPQATTKRINFRLTTLNVYIHGYISFATYFTKHINVYDNINKSMPNAFLAPGVAKTDTDTESHTRRYGYVYVYVTLRYACDTDTDTDT